MDANDDDRDQGGRGGSAAVEHELGRGRYGPGARDEVTVPGTGPVRAAKQGDFGDSVDVTLDAETLRDGGPTSTGGVRTTTGSSAGPGGAGRPPPAAAAGDSRRDLTVQAVTLFCFVRLGDDAGCERLVGGGHLVRVPLPQ
ncbi:hypothetical protein Daura_32220 [Dactylosporangium aurantiacum]|uniref:Uncharacterized protein n=1 Tax=Dactylosporangium aurantiacum TaxID=35754 RepID=A0A9Q9I811_9ACTN|nr:hypothetical protein [Dactylosporangium aurantiacum]MDG6107106.1 hypothetical protein [Dactylosporangium aurantiacum]UWZ51404.1 hypothetical protein Daura_32220 [Dactylosporangium aurantiacum]